MISEYQFFYLDTRENQIQKLESKKSSLRPYILGAYEIVVPGDKIEKEDDADLLIKLILYLAEKYKEYEELKHGEPTYSLFNLPEGHIMSNEIVKKILPEIKKLRKELFSKEASPFPKSDNKALIWLKEQSKKDIHLTTRATIKNKSKINTLLREISNNIGEIQNLTYEKFELTSTSRFLPYPSKGGWKEVIPVKENSQLARLADKTKKISELTNFSQAQLVKFVLIGIKPLIPIYSLKVEYPARSVSLKIYRPIDKKLIELLSLQIKEIFERKRKHSLEKKHKDLYCFIEAHGGPPKRNKTAFWTKIMEEWNNSHKDQKYAYPNSVNMAYRRIVRAVQSGVSPLNKLDEELTLGKDEIKPATKEEWEKHKRELRKIAKYHEKVLREIKDGKRKTTKVSGLIIK